MFPFLFFYIILSILGWLCFPIAYRYLYFLSDRGFGVSRTLGLLLWAYIFWMLASLHFIRNNVAGIIFSLMIVVFINYWSIRKTGIKPLWDWIKEKRKTVIVVEVLFLVSFGMWTIVRAANPEILGTEKPMELAFINAILRSDTFPPHDPWLSGYAISYYYFGYVMVALLAKLGGVEGGIAFNLAVSMIFGLSALGAYSLVYNLLEARAKVKNGETRYTALLAPVFVLLFGNLEGFLEMLHGRGIFWLKQAGNVWFSPIWKWLDLVELSEPPVGALSWVPTRYYWWWRASRVIQDYDAVGNLKEVINEFPAFSYLLADLHPHVLAMPFAFLAIAFSMQLFWQAKVGLIKPWRKYPFYLLLLALVMGGLAFLNTWDFPFYVAFAAGAYVIGSFMTTSYINGERFREHINPWLELFVQFFLFVFMIGIAGILLYLPFYIGFSSQAGGILPNLIYPTRGVHLWIMFAPLWLSIFVYLLYLILRYRVSLYWGVLVSAGLALVMFLLSLLFGFVILAIPQVSDIYMSSLAASDENMLFHLALFRRLVNNGGWLTLLVLFGVVIAIIRFSLLQNKSEDQNHSDKQLHPVDSFVLIMILLGVLLVFIPEFFYLRDQFGWRINTIFKFYYQAWLLWGISAAYATACLIAKLRKTSLISFCVVLCLVSFASLTYLGNGLWTKTSGFKPAGGWTLDGTRYFAQQSADEMSAINWLKQAEYGIVAETISYTGGSYSDYGRVSTLSGLPTVLGWIGHESQWRGGGTEMGSRQADIERLYCSRQYQDAKEVINKYNIRYIYVGALERATYLPGQGDCTMGLNENLLFQFFDIVYQQGEVTIFETRSSNLDPIRDVWK